MSELQILIENIRTAISFPETVPPEQIRAHARRYAEACTELNRRMMQCIQHIRAGNIAEGIRMAELKPNLPEMFLSLDMPEREDWEEIVSTLGFDQPSPLPSELMRELNEAYLKLSPLEPLLRWHRLYALNGSPMRERLSVLRAIAKTDHENMFWMEDQEKFEKVRLKELEREISKSIETKNALQIRMLHAELSSPDWIIPPPIEFRRRLSGAVLQDYADSLMDYFAVFDFANAGRSYGTIQQILASENMALPVEIQMRIRAAVLWLEETQRQNALQGEFDHAVMILRSALEEEAPLPKLERLYYTLSTAATQAGTVIPEELEELYQAETSRQHTSATRRNQLVVVSVIAACLLAGVILALGLNQRLYAGRVRDTLVSLQKIETEELYEDIAGTLERIETNSPDIAKNTEVTVAMQRLRSMLDEDGKRAADFARYHSLADGQLGTPEKPEFQELLRIGISVDQAGKLARSSREKTLYAELKRKFDTAMAMRKREIDEKYSKTLTEVSDDFNAAGRDSDLSASELLTRLKEAARRLEILQKTPDVSESLKEQGVAVAGMIAEQEKKTQRRLEQESVLKNLFSQVPHWDNYQSVLRRFAADFSEHHAAEDAKDVLKEWDGIKETAMLLQELANSYTQAAGDFGSLQKESDTLWKKYQELSSRLSGSSSALFPPGELLEELAKITPYSPNQFRSTESLLKSLSQRNVYPWVDERSGNWYYLTRKPDKPDSYTYITTFVSEEKTYRIRDGEFNIAKIPTVTQQEFAAYALKKIDGIKNDADAVVCDIMDELLKKKNGNETGLDPILQCVVADLLIADMSKVDSIFESNFKRSYEIIQKSGVDLLTNWMDVQSKNTNPQRNMARAAIGRLPQMKTLAEKTRRERSQFKERLAQYRPHFDWVGVTTKKNGKWDCVLKTGGIAVESGDLYVFRQTADQNILPIKISRISSGKVELHGGESSLIQGLPVFWVSNR